MGVSVVQMEESKVPPRLFKRKLDLKGKIALAGWCQARP